MPSIMALIMSDVQGQKHTVEAREGFSAMLDLPLIGQGPYVLFTGSIQMAGHSLN